MNRERVTWIDVAKILGMFAIYIGHFSVAGGRITTFVFAYHVPLFFFVSGCMENYNKEEKVIKYISKKIKKILVPFWIFSILSSAVYIITYEPSWYNIYHYILLPFLKGAIRNQFVAASLWFLTCLFVVQVIFFCLKKIFINRYIVLLLCILICYFLNYRWGIISVNSPRWFYNVDSALYYIAYYAIGYVSFPFVQKLFLLDAGYKKCIFGIAGFVTLIYSGLFFIGYDCLILLGLTYFWHDLFRALILVWMVLVISRMFTNEKLSCMGKDTLFFCGAEFFSRRLCEEVLSILGLDLNLSSPFAVFLYAILLIFISQIGVNWWLKKISGRVERSLDILLGKKSIDNKV